MKRSSQSEVKLGLIQTDVSANPDANLNENHLAHRTRAKAAQRSSARRSFIARNIFARARITITFKLAERIPGPSTDAFQKLAKKHKVVIIGPRCSRKRASGVYHNTAASHRRRRFAPGHLSQDAHPG